jgi:hypothetical protein
VQIIVVQHSKIYCTVNAIVASIVLGTVVLYFKLCCTTSHTSTRTHEHRNALIIADQDYIVELLMMLLLLLFFKPMVLPRCCCWYVHHKSILLLRVTVFVGCKKGAMISRLSAFFTFDRELIISTAKPSLFIARCSSSSRHRCLRAYSGPHNNLVRSIQRSVSVIEAALCDSSRSSKCSSLYCIFSVW